MCAVTVPIGGAANTKSAHAKSLIYSAARLTHEHGDDRARGECQNRNYTDRPSHSENIRDDSGRECADSVAKVAPEAIDAQRACAPSRVEASETAAIRHG